MWPRCPINPGALPTPAPCQPRRPANPRSPSSSLALINSDTFRPSLFSSISLSGPAMLVSPSILGARHSGFLINPDLINSGFQSIPASRQPRCSANLVWMSAGCGSGFLSFIFACTGSRFTISLLCGPCFAIRLHSGNGCGPTAATAVVGCAGLALPFVSTAAMAVVRFACSIMRATSFAV